MNRDPTYWSQSMGPGSFLRPDRPIFTRGNERTTVTAIYNRIAMDAASIEIKHVLLDDSDRFQEVVHSGLNNCLSTEANIDQSGRSFMQDVYESMFDEGAVALVPVETDGRPDYENGFDILTMRTAKIIEWFPEHIRVRIYNDRTGQKEEIIVPKRTTAIVENPFFAVMNEPNSTMQRLIRKLSILDAIDEQSGSGKLDLIVQLPYTVKGDLKRQQAEERRASIERQLTGSRYGIAYIDSTEHVTQLNRSLDNNLMKQIEYLTSTLYSQLGITAEIMNGTADEQTMLNYTNRTIEPCVAAVADAMKRSFLTVEDRKNHQSVEYFTDPFRLVPAGKVAELADKFTRNEIMTSNEFRKIVGLIPSNDPSADELRNKNLSVSKEYYKNRNEQLDEVQEENQNA